MNKNNKILITGSSGLIGSSLCKILRQEGYNNLLEVNSKILDLRDQQKVNEFFSYHKPEYVFHLAARVGGIVANNTLTGQFIYDNTMMQMNVIDASQRNNIKKLLFPGSACTYPRNAVQPVKESDFMQGMPEITNIAYATAKINGVIMCSSYKKQYGLNVVIPMPTNTYGINDHFNLETSHVIPALIKKFYQAKLDNLESVVMWGTGSPLREFIYADDVSRAFIFLMNNYDSDEIINVGTMEETSILNLTKTIADIIGYKGNIINDTTKPDGIPRKCLDSTKLYSLGFKPSISLREGLSRVCEHYIQNVAVCL